MELRFAVRKALPNVLMASFTMYARRNSHGRCVCTYIQASGIPHVYLDYQSCILNSLEHPNRDHANSTAGAVDHRKQITLPTAS
jgi:hypothetical protein